MQKKMRASRRAMGMNYTIREVTVSAVGAPHTGQVLDSMIGRLQGKHHLRWFLPSFVIAMKRRYRLRINTVAHAHEGVSAGNNICNPSSTVINEMTVALLCRCTSGRPAIPSLTGTGMAGPSPGSSA
jgi:hypothetical protein